MFLTHVAGLIITNRKILLIKRSEQEDSEPGKWCLPNETVEENEQLENAIVRGMKEELGVDFEVEQIAYEHHYFNHTTYVYLGNMNGEILPNSEEVAEYRWCTFDETLRLNFAYGYEQVIETIKNLIS